MDKIGIRTIVVNFDDEQLPYLSLVQGDAKTRGFDIVICDSDGKEIPPSDDYIVELIATGSNAPDTPYANRHTIKDGKYRVMIPTEALSESGFVFLQLVFYQKSTGAVIHTIEQKCPVYRSRGQEVVESNNLYVDITALRLGIEKIAVMETAYLQVLEDEATRKSSEIKREENEVTRIAQEKDRVTAEEERVSNERQRNENESQRITAEEEREIKFDEWDKTMQGIIPNATEEVAGSVKVKAQSGETAPHTVPSLSWVEDRFKQTVLGVVASASGDGAIAIGKYATSSGQGSITIGGRASADYLAVAVGAEASATGWFSTAVGAEASAIASYSTAIGFQAKSDEQGLGVLGTSSGTGTNRWIVPGDFSVGGTKNFEIPHPNPEKTETHVLRHGAVETNSQGDNLYRYKIKAEKGNDLVTINLPDYFIYLNKNIQIWATGVDHFGNAFGTYYPDKEEIVITCEKQGEYNILVIGTRNDSHKSVQSWSDKKEVKLKGTSWTFEEDKKRDVEE